MENADLQVLTQLRTWMQQGQSSWLCTVVATWGSSPRPVGSMLACNHLGHVSGSLSGGCIEEDLLEKLRQGKLAKDKPEVLIYGKTQEESDRFGLPCGGQLEVVIEPMHTSSHNNNHMACIQQLVAQLEQRQSVAREVNISTGEMRARTVKRFKHLEIQGNIHTSPNKIKMLHTYGPRFQLFLIGAGQVSIYVAEMAKALDYHVIVCDPRKQMIEQWPISNVQLLTMMPDDAVAKFASDKYSAIIALTHDPRIDDMGLMQALKTEAFFVGAMGSSRTSAKRRERLLQLDLSEAEISRLYGPVGLSIGSKTPAEIAISILAQLTKIRAETAKAV